MSLIVILLIIVLICGVGGGGYFYQNRYGRQMDANGTPIMQPMTPTASFGIWPVILIIVLLFLLFGGGLGLHRYYY